MTPNSTPGTRAPLLRALWRPVLGDGLYLVLAVAVLAAVVRAVGMLGPPRLFWVLPVGFILMAMTPIVFMGKEGRRRAGLRFPKKPVWILLGILLGIAAAFFLYWLGVSLFGQTDDNWFISVRRSFPDTPQMSALTAGQLFWAITIPSMIFSPLGEELFFRGFLHQVARERWNQRTAVLIDASLFAAIHVLHHGVVRIAGQINVFPISGALWVVFIFATGVMFSFLRQKTGSLVAPVLSHAAFNLGMNVAIFYLL